jgi:sucrose synthase
VIPPGVDEELYFPYFDGERRLSNETERLEARLFHDSDPTIVGTLHDPGLPPIFTMARLDRIKNITGLVEAYGKCEPLRLRANLIVVAGRTSQERSADEEEAEGIQRMHELIAEYGLEGHVRWLEAFPKEAGAEAYRIVAERRGVFVQPAKFEGFGLTVLEAMACGLPTFATEFGGPSEIIQHGRNGFLINPTVPERISEPLLTFFREVDEDPGRWDALSKAGIERVREAFTWELYGNRLIDLTKLYGFWRFSVASEGKEELSQYCHLLFHLFYKPRADALVRRAG